MTPGEGCAAQGKAKAKGRADPFVTHPPLNGCYPELVSGGRRSVLLHVGVAQALAERGAGAVGFAAGHRVGAIIGGVEGARPVVARQADPAERRVRRSTV